MEKQKKTIKEETMEEYDIVWRELEESADFKEEFREWVIETIHQTLQRFIRETNIELGEELAELEHKQWESWTKYLYENHKDRLIDNLVTEKWDKNWKPYSELTEEDKDKDRIWADKVLEKLNQTQAKWLKDNLN